MVSQSSLKLHARETAYTVVVEPWAEEFVVNPCETCRVVASHPSSPPVFEVEVYRGLLIVTVSESGSTYEFWRGETKEFWTPVPIP